MHSQIENASDEKVKTYSAIIFALDKHNCEQKVLKRILKGKPAPNVPVFKGFSLKSPKTISEVYAKSCAGIQARLIMTPVRWPDWQ
jgi:hypothetical protein